MKKKKISLKLVTLVMSGTLLATPMVSSAEEVGNNSTTSSTNTSESTAGTGSTATASENTAGVQAVPPQAPVTPQRERAVP